MMIARDRVNVEKQVVDIFKELADSAEEITALIRFQSMDVYQICETVFSKRKDSFSSFAGIRRDFNNEWSKACKQDIMPLSEEAFRIFESAGNFLGQYDAETQLKRLEYIKSELIARRDLLFGRLSEKKKLYYCIGGFAGIMLCLILL